MVCYLFTKAVGENKEWNDIWAEILKKNTLLEFSVDNINSQYDREFEEWIKKNPKELKIKRKLLWEKAIVNYIGSGLGKTDFCYLFSNWMIPIVNKSKNQKVVVDGVIIEKFLQEIRKGEGIINYEFDNEEEQKQSYVYLEFLTRGMEKAVFSHC